MGIRTIAVGAVVAAALASSLTGLAAGSSSARHHSALRLVKPMPLKVRGLGFRADERVRLVAKSGNFTSTKRLRASSNGSFAVAFRLGASHCSGLLVVATGNAGSRATLKRPPPPECMPS
jgi:hypothetical protein